MRRHVSQALAAVSVITKQMSRKEVLSHPFSIPKRKIQPQTFSIQASLFYQTRMSLDALLTPIKKYFIVTK